ncbi:MAG: phosphoglycerate kinase [Dehalococcoidales bacterium]
MNKKTIKDISVDGKRVLVRVDFNVPLDNSGEITDDSRIRAALPTIEYLIGQTAKVILLSHFGRPKGRVVEELRLTAVARRLSQIMGRPVKMTADCVGPEVERSIAAMANGDILLLENLRFHAGEESGDASFSAALAELGDVFVNDAFGTSHRAHASISGITNYLPAVAGFLLQKEVQALSKIIGDTAHPFASVLGGAKISDKVAMIENIMPRVDSLLIGGAMASTFLKALSYPVGLSLVEDDMLETARGIVRKTENKGVRLLLPTDVIVAGEISDRAATEVIAIENIPPDKKIVDMGPGTIDSFGKELNNCKTVFWNGPMGLYEIPGFAGGTRALAEVIANLDAATIIGGGSTADIIYEMGLADKMTFISTGGGASLEFLSGETLPGVAALLDTA